MVSVCFMACLTYPDSTLCWYHAPGTKHTIINLLECMSVCVLCNHMFHMHVCVSPEVLHVHTVHHVGLMLHVLNLLC